MEKSEITVNEKPQFVHDCKSCIFLGRLEDDGKFGEADLYFCDCGTAGWETVIARYGDLGYEYASGMMFAKPDVNKQLYEAKMRAIKLGLYKE